MVVLCSIGFRCRDFYEFLCDRLFLGYVILFRLLNVFCFCCSIGGLIIRCFWSLELFDWFFDDNICIFESNVMILKYLIILIIGRK